VRDAKLKPSSIAFRAPLLLVQTFPVYNHIRLKVCQHFEYQET